MSRPWSARRVRSSITISSSEQLPARSPMPLIAHSTCRAPASTPAKELATASPRSSWQWTERRTSAQLRDQLVEPAEEGRVLGRRRVADGVGDVDHPGALGDRDRADLGRELDVGPGGVHRRELDVVAELAGVGDGGLRLALDVLAVGLELVLDVDVGGRDERVDPRPLGVLDRSPRGLDVAPSGSAPARRSTGPETVRAIASTASKSPGEVIGKPASITSTPSRASCVAISTFSCVLSEIPGDCSPSRSVVSKISTRSCLVYLWCLNAHG